MSPQPRFTDHTLTFLRALKRHTNREWFGAHKDDYEAHVADRCSRSSSGWRPISPGSHPIWWPRRAACIGSTATHGSRQTRPLQDTRLSRVPAPGAAQERERRSLLSPGPRPALDRRRAVCPTDAAAAADPGPHRGPPPQLPEPGRVAGVPAARRRDGLDATTGATGFPQDHKAAEYLKLKQYLAGGELDPTLATSPRFYGALLRRFTVLAPFIHFLNTPLIAAARFKL